MDLFFVVLFSIGNTEVVLAMLGAIDPFNSTSLAPILYFVVFFGVSLVLRHAFSTLVRSLERHVMNWLLGDPERAVLPCLEGRCDEKSVGKFFTESFREMFAAKHQEVFRQEIGPHNVRSIPRLVRSYVFHQSESARASRDRIIRARSFCANMAMACLGGSIINTNTLPISIHLLLLSSAALLIVKQRSLDEREAKENYAYFLVL